MLRRHLYGYGRVFPVRRPPEIHPDFAAKEMVVKKFLLMLAVVAMASAESSAGIALTNVAPSYTEDFNSLVNTGTSTTLPTDWTFSESGSSANTTYAAGTGSDNAGNTYSFGSAASTERALGGVLSNNLTTVIGASFTNGGVTNITAVAISYTGEQWRLGSTGRADRLDFQYSVDATSLTTGTWTDVDSLDFTAPVTVGTVGALNGNAAANRTAVSSSFTVAIPVNGTFRIRWNDFNASGADDGLAVDDFKITGTFAAIPEPGAYMFFGLASVVTGAGYWVRKRLVG